MTAPGKKTSEFIVTIVLAIVIAAQGIIPEFFQGQQWVPMALAILGGLYTLGRSAVKVFDLKVKVPSEDPPKKTP